MCAPTDFQYRDEVRYVPMHAYGDNHHTDCEVGIVTSLTRECVFVRFDGEITSKACYARDLTLLRRQS